MVHGCIYSYSDKRLTSGPNREAYWLINFPLAILVFKSVLIILTHSAFSSGNDITCKSVCSGTVAFFRALEYMIWTLFNEYNSPR